MLASGGPAEVSSFGCPPAGAGGHGVAAGVAIALQQDRHQSTFGFLGKGQTTFFHVDADEVTELDLAGGNKIRQGKDNVLFDRPLQVPRTVLWIGAFQQQELLDRAWCS